MGVLANRPLVKASRAFVARFYKTRLGTPISTLSISIIALIKRSDTVSTGLYAISCLVLLKARCANARVVSMNIDIAGIEITS